MTDPQQLQQTNGGFELAPQADALGYLAMIAEDYGRAPSAAVGTPPGTLPPAVGERRRPEERDLPPALLALVEQARAVYPDGRLTLLKYRRTLNDGVTTEIDDGDPLPGADALVALSVTTSSTMRDFQELVVDMLLAAWDGGGPVGNPTM
jgi:hypothetical protein